jgi:hypothetical protein
MSTAPLQLQVLTNSCGANQMQDFFQVVNAGSTPVTLSDISIKFWADDTSGQAIVPHVWTGGCVTGVGGNPSCVHQVTGVTPTAASFSPACGPDATHQANWEVTITNTDSTTLPPGAFWSNIQSALNLADYSNFSPGTGSWFSPCLSGTSYAADPHFAVYFQGNLVFSSGINAPDCRAPHGSQQLHGYVSILPASSAPVLRPVDPGTNLALDIGLPAQAGLQDFVRSVSDPKDPNFRAYLDVPTFAKKFGALPLDYQNTVNWATAAGMTVTNQFPNNLLLRATGTAAQIEQALFTNLFWRQRPDGSQFVAVDREPSVNLAPNLLWISGLTDFISPLAGGGTSTQTGAGASFNYYGYDFRNAYFQNCLTLPGSSTPIDGTGQTVAVLSLNADSTLSQDVALYDAAQNPTLNQSTIMPFIAISAPVPLIRNGLVGGANGPPEVAADVELVQSMAPGANVLIFEQGVDWENHADGIYHAMATTPSVTVATSSWTFGYTANEQQAVWEMAAQGVSFFQYSGDFGAEGDPEDNRDMDGETLVGGTILNTNPLTGAANTVNPYPATYYQNEQTWPNSGGGVLGGGGPCYALGICPPRFLPGYQATLPVNTNGGSTSFRNYPDVAMDVNMVQTFNKSFSTFQGTSVATPLWAGFAALVNQRAAALGAKRLGFANPTIYDIGLTRGTANDLYTNFAFNDLQDNVFNPVTCFAGNCPSSRPPGPGFKSVPGYDLVTGWGTPTCGLLTQVSTNNPLTPQTILTNGVLQITTGKDDLRTDSAATAKIFFQGLPNNPVFIDLKDANAGSFDGGTMRAFQFVVPAGLNLTPAIVSAGLGGITDVRLNLIENLSNGSGAEDNWDIGAVNVRLFAPTISAEMCQLDLVETSSALANTNDPGVVRLSATPSASGVGPTADLPLSGQSTGCVSTGSPTPASPAQAQFIISTGDDSIRGDSTATVQVFGSNKSAPPFLQANLPTGGQNGDVFNIKLAVPANAPPINQWQVVLTLTSHNSFIETDDHWHVDGVNVMEWGANQPENCVLRATGEPLADLSNSSITLPATQCN